ENLRKCLEESRGNLADIAYTLGVGRRAFAHRRAVVCSTAREGADALERLDHGSGMTGEREGGRNKMALRFPGQGSQYVNMGRELYERGGYYAEKLEECAEVVRRELGLDLREAIYPKPGKEKESAERLGQTFGAQPVIYAVSYSLAMQWMRW